MIVIEQKSLVRLVAQKTRLKDVVSGKYITQEGFNPNYVITDYGQKISRVHVLATVVNTFMSEDNKYAFLVLDDGTETIRSKVFQDTKIFDNVKVGDIIDFVGKVREYNDERYIVPEIVKKINDPNCETLRKLEILKSLKEWKSKRDVVLKTEKEHEDIDGLKKDLKSKGIKIKEKEIENILEGEKAGEEKEEETAGKVDEKNARKMVMEAIQELDKGEGVDYADIIEKVNLPENVTETAINELLAEGSCYEPRAGKIKVL